MDEIKYNEYKERLDAARKECRFLIDFYNNSVNEFNKAVCLNRIKEYQDKILIYKNLLEDCGDDEVDTWYV